MTHAKDEALKQALEALEDERYVPRYTHIKEAIAAIRTALAQPKQPVMKWHKGEPPYPYKTEWFIARTRSRDRVVLQALPEEYSYDYTTADGTYIKADQITKWMQFPDSMLIAFESPPMPVQPEQAVLANTIALIKECQTALAEELAACDIDPPLHHVLAAHDKCVDWLVSAGVLVYCTACERNVRGPCTSIDCSTPEPTPQPVQIGENT